MRPSRTVAILALIAGVALLLRVHGAARSALTADEALVWSFARDVSLAPGEVRLVSRTADHPFLGAYLVALSAGIFGSSDLGLRLLYVLFGAATVVLVFRLGADLWGPQAGLVAAALVAVDRFHASWTRLIVEEAPLLLLETLALGLLWRALASGRVPTWIGAGVALGAAALVKETALVLLPGCAAGLLLLPRGRAALRTRGPWLFGLVVLLGAAADLAVSAGAGDTHWTRAGRFLEAPAGVTAKGLTLYVGELLRLVVSPDVLDVAYEEARAFAVFWPVGLLYLAGVGAALSRRDDLPSRFLLGPFAVVVLAATVVDAAAVFDPFWWTSPSLVPAVLLAGRLLAPLAARPASRAALWLAWAALAVNAAAALAARGDAAPRMTRRQWAALLAADGALRLESGDLRTAREQAHLSLTLDPGSRAARALLRRLDEPAR